MKIKRHEKKITLGNGQIIELDYYGKEKWLVTAASKDIEVPEYMHTDEVEIGSYINTHLITQVDDSYYEEKHPSYDVLISSRGKKFR